MHISLTFIRILFLAISVLLFATFTTARASDSSLFANLVIGIASGIAFGGALIGFEFFFKRINLRTFNTTSLGLFFGLLMGISLTLIIQTALDASNLQISQDSLTLLRIGIFLISAYLGMTLTAKAAEEIFVSIPFVRFKPNSQKKKDLLIDTSLLSDSRIIDLAASGLLDDHLVLARFLVKELHENAESADEMLKLKARRCLDVVKKLENMPTLGLRYADTDFTDTKDTVSKLIRLAKLLDAHIFIGDTSRIQPSSADGVRIIYINLLALVLKPLAQAGEFINIKVQRYGKEPRQGVGYLDDGTMVVVNGGAEYIGETIRAQVLSVKHTSSGRMIFCNTIEEHQFNESVESPSMADDESHQKSYFPL